MRCSAISSVLFFLINITIAQAIGEQWVNVEYIKTIDVSKAYIQEVVQLKIRNVGKESEDLYLIPFPIEVAETLSTFSCMLKGKNVFVDSALMRDYEELPNGDKVQFGSIKLPSKVEPEGEIELLVHYAHNSNYAPMPSQIAMEDAQTLLLETDVLPFSVYPTEIYTLNIMGTNSIQKYDGGKIDEPTESISISKEGVIDAYSISKGKFLYTHNLPLTRVTHLNREAWVSHWASTVEFKEDYELVNNAAELSEGFSRADFLKSGISKKAHHVLLALDVQLPENSEYHYYTDLVGMISTSKVLGSRMILKPRFPIFGGWRFDFTIGWTNPLSQVLKSLSDDEYILSIPMLQGPLDTFYDSVDLSIFLPEGAVVEEVQVPMMQYSSKISTEHSYLDLGSGHTKLTIVLKNLNDDLREGPVFVRYTYNKIELLRKPFSIAMYVFIAILSLYVLKQVRLIIQ